MSDRILDYSFDAKRAVKACITEARERGDEDAAALYDRALAALEDAEDAAAEDMPATRKAPR